MTVLSVDHHASRHARMREFAHTGMRACRICQINAACFRREIMPENQDDVGAGVLIAVGNQKGGVGKTTNTVHVAAALGLRGRRCLIIDLDPTGGATKHLGVPQDSYAGTLELLTTDESIESLVVTERMPEGVHLVPARPQLTELDSQLSKFVDRTTILERPIREARRLYDFVFLDTSPSPAATTTVAAYATAEWFLLSAFPHPLSLSGLSDAFKDIADARHQRNPNLEVLGIIFSNVDRRATRLRAELEKVVNDAMPDRSFRSTISQAVILPELSGRGKTVYQIPSFTRIPAAHQYMLLACEIEHRVQNRESFLKGDAGPVIVDWPLYDYDLAIPGPKNRLEIGPPSELEAVNG
jgi:chromosome partitioning protein